MEDNNIIVKQDGKDQLPLPPENPIDEGIVVPVTPADKD